MNFNRFFVSAAFVTIAVGCAKEQVGGAVDVPADEVNVVVDAPKVIAQFNEPETRTIINADSDATGKLPMLWTPSDEVGVFTSGGNKNVRYQNDERTDNVPNTTFSALASASGEIEYVYYPYSETNNGKTVTALVGSIPGEQVMGQEVVGDYKRGVLLGGTEEGNYRFKFYNIFSLIRFNINASGTALEGKTLDSITLTVTRAGAAVPVVGDFTFSALDGTYNLGVTSNVLTTTWNMPFAGLLTSYASVLPEIRKGDILNFVIKAGDYEAALSVASSADFAPGAFYNFPLTLEKFDNAGLLKVKKTVRGEFTAATYNVDGLPNITVNLLITKIQLNPTGPLEAGTKTISEKIKDSDWDFVGFSEDFCFHDALRSSASSVFDFQEYDNAEFPTSYYVGITSGHWATDGLSFATRKSSCTFSLIKKVTFPDSAVNGGLTSGANESIDKGYRHYLVTLSDGVELDVIITHMNTYSDSGTGHINAQHAQLKLIAQYINSIRGNNRPIIFMGDTNLRYTRHDFNTYFWQPLDDDLYAQMHDPWVDFQWNGVFPEYGGKSLMVSDATGTDSKTDIICENTQKGEVVDKIIYINNPNSKTTITATSYLRDYDGFKGLADHMPIVAEFKYESVVDVK